ncbi:uncharacterized protein FA14DRAFT_159326 [Meira miltonrushii]|uniref:E3 ubiquitin-protein ligase n=1 Tax=Meira miltonrushii TaxID=1280837 RepID=A0A316VIU1_9BASI|nr:uncharacterized protein FA14DRAFT_159326 [Meira miltonrushii]PWN37144.1 hypothetical protein FA14DRAFT_159326 [Meira miltonrushii]
MSEAGYGIDDVLGSVGMDDQNSLPSTIHFLRQAQLDPRSTNYAVTGGVISQLYRSLWTAIFTNITPAHLLPREVAPTMMHAMVFLERCNWNLCAAQKRASLEINEQRRERLGGVTSASFSNSSLSSNTNNSSSPLNASPLITPGGAKGKFVPPRSATPPPGLSSEEVMGAEYGEDRKGMPCGHVFKKGEAIYRCRDCALDDTCVLCAPCFNASNHEGHDIVFSVSNSSGGCCDCGDEEAWTKRICCRYHDAGEAHSSKYYEAGPSQENEASHDTMMDEDFSMQNKRDPDSYDIKGKGPERRSGTTSDYIDQIESLLTNVPQDAKTGFLRQVSSMIAFILDTMEHAPAEMKLPEGPDAIEIIKRQKTLEPPEPEDEDLDYMPGPGAYSFDSNQNKLYTVVLWNDEKHSFRDVIDIICEVTNKTETEAKGIAERVDRHGREIIETSSDLRRMYLLAHKLGQIDLAVTIRPAYDVYAEEIAGHVLELLLDLSNASFGTLSPSSKSPPSTHPLDNLVPSAVAMRALLGRAFLNDWEHRLPVTQGDMTTDFFDNSELLQLDGMLLMDYKMWKGARANARSLYMALIGPREVKRALAYRFACMFSKLVEIFIVKDREPEHSIRFIAVQLFSVPSIASELVINLDLLHKMLQILQAIFTGQLTLGTLSLPPTAPPRMQASPSSMLVRQQRCHYILYDLRYLLGAEGVQKQIVSDTRHLGYFAEFLSLFNAITPDRRAVTEHVEFESEVWVPIFNVATHLARTIKLFGESYGKGTGQELLRGLLLAMEKTLLSCSHLHQNDPDSHATIAFNRINFAGVSYHIIDFTVESMGVSFHHPMHWMLAEMLKSVNKLDYEFLHQMRKEKLADLIPEETGENGLIVLFEFPLRVVVKLAQIRAGLWVRNGFGIRSQAHHYRDNSMRDVMYDQDLYMLQCSLVFVKPDRMLVTFAQRFSLISWLQGHGNQTGFEMGQLLFLAEELILLLVTLLSETSTAMHRSMDDLVRREIVHFLALNQGTYSELTRHISDKLKDHANFDRVLASVSNYRAPDGTNDLGIFELKDECYDEVQPFFYHYTRNQREKAEQVLKDRQKRKTSAEEAKKYVILPHKRLAPGQAVFVDTLRNALLSPVLMQIIFSCLVNVNAGEEEMPDGLVDGCLQLLLMGLVEQEAPFASALCERRTEPEGSGYESMMELLLALRKVEKFSNFKAKLEWILNRAAKLDSDRCGRIVDALWHGQERKDGAAGQISAEDKRKAAAKARQAAIMQSFSAQQKSLLESLEDEEVDDQLDEDEKDLMDEGEDGDTRQVSFGSCIFCQEDLNGNQSFGSLAHIQSSRIMRNTPRHDSYSLQQSLQTPLTLDRNGAEGKRVRGDSLPQSPDKTSHSHSRRQWDGFPSEERRFGFYTSTCGHLMHLECFEVYCRSIEQRHAQQIARNHPEDLARSEFVCPLCKSLGNVILPVPKAASKVYVPIVDQTTISDWIRKINIDILKSSTNSLRSDLQETENGTGCFVPWFAEDAQIVLDSWISRMGTASNSSSEHPNRQFLERLCRVLRPLSTKSRAMRVAHQSRTILAPPSRKMYIPEEVIAYTIDVLEIAQRGTTPTVKEPTKDHVSAPNVSDGMTEQTMDLIVAFITCLRDLAKLEEPNYQAIFRHGLLMRLLPHWGGHDTVRSPLVLRDPMTLLVEAAAVIPGNLPQVTILMFYVQLIQVVFGVAQPSLWPQSGPGGSARGMPGLRTNSNTFAPGEEGNAPFAKSDNEAISQVFDDVRGTVANIIGLVGYARGNITLGVDNLDDASLAKMICTYCLPFLRRATLLQRAMGVLPLQEKNQEDLSSQSEFIRLMKLLNIPFPREALSATATRQTALAGLVEGWIKHAYPQLASIFRPLPIQPSPLSVSSKSGHHHHPHHPTLQLEHPHIYELIKLPVNLTTLLMQCQVMKCKRCGNSPPEPAICLECGEILCFQSFCCQGGSDGHGECNRHLEECGHSTGLFFKIKSNIIVLLFQGKGCFTYSPYLDAHGEIDIGLKKGKIQFLHTIRFDELRRQWLQHGIANMIARKIEAVMDQGGWVTM